MKLSSFFYALVTSILVLVAIAVGGFDWLKPHSLALAADKSAQNPNAAIFVPKQTAVMVSLLVNPDRLDGFGVKNKRRSREQLDQIKQSFLANTGLNYRQDIQPWLGNQITLAVTTPDVDRNGQNGKQPGYLLALDTKNAEKSKEFVQLFWQKRTVAPTELVSEQYQGVNLIYSNPETKNQNVASAVVGDRFVLFANSPKVLRDAINNVQAVNLSLSNDSSYQRSLQALTEPKIGLSYINLPVLAGLIGNNSELVSQYQNLAIALSPKQQGLMAETALIPASGQESATTSPALKEPVGALQYIPATSAIAIAGTDLNQLWNRVSSGLNNNDTLAQVLNRYVIDLEAQWGIQLPQDIFKWVQGEYALALLPRPERNNPDLIFVADKSFATAEESIDRLDAIAKQRGFSAGSLPLENKTISAWTKLTTTLSKDGEDNKKPVVLNAEVQGVHADAGKYEIFTTSVEAMDRALKASDNLITSAKFKDAIAPLPKSNNGYLYLDWGASQPFLERQLPIIRVLKLFGKPLFDNLRSLTFTSEGSDAGIQHSKVFLQLS